MRVMSEKPKAISLFAGAGGLDLGVDSAGFHTICAIEIDQHCISTLLKNSNRKHIWQVDVRALDPVATVESLGTTGDEIGLLHGGPPCQPFSQIGSQSGIADPRGLLVFEMVRFTAALKPSAVLIEQVPRFLTSIVAQGMTMVDALREEFFKIGYELHAEIANAAEFGVPQVRKRAILVALQRGQSFRFPDSKTRQCKTVGKAIGDLPEAVSSGCDPHIPNHVDITPDRDRYRISFVDEGEWLAKSESAPPDVKLKLTAKDSTKYRRLHRDLPALTLRCGEIPYHPLENRYLTPRETARLQGFPDRHVFVGPIRRRTGTVRNLDQHRQVANAVPPPLAKHMAERVKASLCL